MRYSILDTWLAFSTDTYLFEVLQAVQIQYLDEIQHLIETVLDHLRYCHGCSVVQSSRCNICHISDSTRMEECSGEINDLEV